jgi:hypothetical protein
LRGKGVAVERSWEKVFETAELYQDHFQRVPVREDATMTTVPLWGRNLPVYEQD